MMPAPKGGTVRHRPPKEDKTICLEPGCNRPRKGRYTLCDMHQKAYWSQQKALEQGRAFTVNIGRYCNACQRVKSSYEFDPPTPDMEAAHILNFICHDCAEERAERIAAHLPFIREADHTRVDLKRVGMTYQWTALVNDQPMKSGTALERRSAELAANMWIGEHRLPYHEGKAS